MIRDVTSNTNQNEDRIKLTQSSRNIHESQENIYKFFLDIVNKWSPETILLEFKRFFIYYEADAVNAEALVGLSDIIFSNSEEEFRNALKRCCYIIINNWEAKRHYRAIGELIELFTDLKLTQKTLSPTLSRLRAWLTNFLNSKDYQELKLFTAKYEDHEKGHWSHRYTSYLLVPQYVDSNNSVEQREAARALSQQLKDKFKFDLAMYTAHSQSATPKVKTPKNPTGLGDEVLRLIKTIVIKPGPFSYTNLAHIFIKQTQKTLYKDFKESIQKYLTFSISNPDFVSILSKRMSEKLETLYEDYNSEILDDALLLRTCNRIIDYLTTENQKEPSALFIALMSQSNPLNLVTVILKIILICKNSRTHLEASIATLIQYYMQYPEDECKWIVNFFDIFNITFAIHAENVEYNLIKMKETANGNVEDVHSDEALDNYRVFSQLKKLDTKVESSHTEIDSDESPFTGLEFF